MNAPPPPRPLCFVAMPFGRKAVPDGQGPTSGHEIDFDEVYAAIAPATDAAGCEPRRADEETADGFIHRTMFEALLVAEIVVADLTFANVNVAYELGVRHGANWGTTVLICEESWIPKLAFDLRPLRVLPYRADDLGPLKEALQSRLEEARRGQRGSGNPIVEVTDVYRSGAGHQKTDIFLARLAYAGETAQEVQSALHKPRPEAVTELCRIRDALLEPGHVVSQLYEAVIALYLGFREHKAYAEMVDLFGRLPDELARTPVAIEQLALARNRLAEAAAKAGDTHGAKALRAQAKEDLQRLSAEQWTSETYGILGRISKGQYDAAKAAGDEALARGALDAAIEAYEGGVRDDLRDTYPGINAVTLRILRGTPDDEAALRRLVPVVRFAADCAPVPSDENEKYWQLATKMELACAERDFASAEDLAAQLRALQVHAWMYETTMGNLALQREARGDEADTVQSLLRIEAQLRPEEAAR